MDDVLPWFVVSLTVIFAAVFEWMRFIFHWSPRPVFMSCLAVAITVYAVRRLVVIRSQVIQERLGLEGELAIGQFLQDELLPKGHRVFHDIIDERGNIDHVVIGPHGVFAVETKTNRKPERGDCRVVYDGDKIWVDGHTPERDPIVQAKACADKLRRILHEFAGRDVLVRPVVLYPGWYVEQPRRPDIWVLNEKAFIKFVMHEPIKLEPADIAVFSAALERYQQAFKKA